MPNQTAVQSHTTNSTCPAALTASRIRLKARLRPNLAAITSPARGIVTKCYSFARPPPNGKPDSQPPTDDWGSNNGPGDARQSRGFWAMGAPNGFESGWNGKSSEGAGWGEQEPVEDWGGWRPRNVDEPQPTASSSSSWQAAPNAEPDRSVPNDEPAFVPPQSFSSGVEDETPFIPSDIIILSDRDKDEILPVAPTGRQAQFYQPKSVSERTVQLAGSLAGVVLFSKTTVLAVPALLYPLWGPWARAGLRNMEVTWNSFSYVGLWRAQVLDVEVTSSMPYSTFSANSATPDAPCVRLVVGDPWRGGARTQLVFPYVLGSEEILTGEPAELMVLSNDPSFVQFKVIREVYLPQTGIWLAEYPFVNRDLFLDISLEVERSRQRSSAPPPPADYAPPTYDVSSDNFAMR